MTITNSFIRKSQEMAKALDIWDAIKGVIHWNDDHAVKSAELFLTIEGLPFVHVNYYDLADTKAAASFMEELDRKSTEIILSPEETDKMYRALEQVIEIPKGVHTFHAHLTEANVVTVDMKYIPMKKRV